MDQYHWNANDQQSQEYDATSEDLLDSKHQIKQQLNHKITEGTQTDSICNKPRSALPLSLEGALSSGSGSRP